MCVQGADHSPLTVIVEAAMDLPSCERGGKVNWIPSVDGGATWGRGPTVTPALEPFLDVTKEVTPATPPGCEPNVGPLHLPDLLRRM